MTNNETPLLSWAWVTNNGVLAEAVDSKELGNILKAIVEEATNGNR